MATILFNYKLRLLACAYTMPDPVQSDQKENKSEQALQIIGHVVAKFYAKIRSMAVDNLWSETLLYNKSYLMNFRRWNYNYAFYW
jgi:hypothetical protein